MYTTSTTNMNEIQQACVQAEAQKQVNQASFASSKILDSGGHRCGFLGDYPNKGFVFYTDYNRQDIINKN